MLRLVGEIDMSSAETLEGILREEREKDSELRLDLSEVTFMDSTGLRVLLSLAASHGVVIVRPSAAVRRLFEVAIPHGVPGMEIRG
ncbi:MAG TPA: STAS domain-containing protein [Actinomycetota bacterium]|nr:STAS domain-containing protein [Actinomycetota bacterium]